MHRILPALTLVILLGLGIPALGADPPPVVRSASAEGGSTVRLGPDPLANGMRTRKNEVQTLAGEFGLHRPYLVPEAHAAPAADKPPQTPQPTPIIGAWFIGFGLLAFVISRRRFKK